MAFCMPEPTAHDSTEKQNWIDKSPVRFIQIEGKASCDTDKPAS